MRDKWELLNLTLTLQLTLTVTEEINKHLRTRLCKIAHAQRCGCELFGTASCLTLHRVLLTVASLDEDSKQYESVEDGPEDLTTVGLDEADEPLDVEIGFRLGSCLLERCHVAEWSERRVAILWISRVKSSWTASSSSSSSSSFIKQKRHEGYLQCIMHTIPK